MKNTLPTSRMQDRAASVLPLTAFTIATLEARLFLEENVPPLPPGTMKTPAMVAGFLRDTVIRPTLKYLDMLGMSADHELVVRHAPWIANDPKAPDCPENDRLLFERPAGILVGCLLFRYLCAMTGQSNNARRSYRNAAAGMHLIVDVDVAAPSIQIFLPESVAMAIGHAVATHYHLGKSIP
ncbi:hypothetical protein AB4090_02320 [Acidithiobacillus sp. IBUN Pt1247-S3]|uniref:hypothetical protein n=1 Tax=Acidithiobacillus sp. IBUN Pt1247-S3 TaxID=3166642 RepID=UPI0034E46D2B